MVEQVVYDAGRLVTFALIVGTVLGIIWCIHGYFKTQREENEIKKRTELKNFCRDFCLLYPNDCGNCPNVGVKLKENIHVVEDLHTGERSYIKVEEDWKEYSGLVDE